MRTGAGVSTIGLLAVVLLAGASPPAESADLQLKEAIRSADHAAVRSLIDALPPLKSRLVPWRGACSTRS